MSSGGQGVWRSHEEDLQLSLVGLVGCFWLLYIPVLKASVPAVSCHGFMQGLDGPFPESLVIQLHSWLFVHSLTHTQTFLHTTSCSYKHAFIH